MRTDLNRFLQAQEKDYEIALAEIKAGQKRSHWMWYIFPQIKGLGLSETSKYYALSDLKEAETYLQHPILGARLREITNALLELPQNDPHIILGYPDDLKLHSCMTLFAQVETTVNSIFRQVIDKFYNGTFDNHTLKILQ